MFPWMIEVKTVDEIEKMRAAGSLARDILDLAGRTVQVGVTTDEIDSVVHAEILRVGINSTVSR
jgi:methionyl aminopeptidase